MITLSVPVRNGRLAVIGKALDAGVAGGLLRLYSAPRPEIGQALAEQVLLAEVRLPQPCMANLEGGRLVFAPIGQALCRRSGIVAWARLCDSDGRWVANLDAGLPDSGAEVELSKLQVFAGGAVNVELAELIE
ncbi:bacteriophage-related protein [Ralstonia solanacearum]|nr:bacteriophage-related protein [Ralstonia solanacearum]